MKEKNNISHGKLPNGTSLFYKNTNDIKLKLLDFLNEYDIFDVDFITYDDVEEDLSTLNARNELINYLSLVKQSEDDNYEFTKIIDEMIKDIESLNESEEFEK